MAYNPQKHHRRSIRLKDYDYSSPGKYFINLCAQNRECRFGKVVNKKMILNAAGTMIDEWWKKVPEKFPNAVLDVYQIMPNHFHSIVGITEWKPEIHSQTNVRADRRESSKPDTENVGADPRIGPGKNDDDNGDVDGVYQGDHAGSRPTGSPQPEFEPKPASVDGIVQWFKSMNTNEYIRGVKKGIYPRFNRRLWQRNYYEHIIRDEKSLERIRDYIINNPAKWDEDRNHPDNF